ncbi:MAG: T9SS type A sorting domain-containing protein, partial [Candidatus Krumholzibacteria bacterium]|nr:T9SS type A sorting domain-containing protein [Candidatus Krumholzibacteria bacterium]
VNLAASDDGGESFLINAPVADVPSNNGTSNPRRYPGNYLEYIGVTGWGEDAFVAWTDTRNSPEPLTDYYFDRVPPDPTPPAIVVTLDPDELWPPNHKWVEVSATVTVSDQQDPAPVFVLESITSNEPGGAEDVKDAAWGTPDVAFKLRAERNGKGRGREYAVVYAASDATGNVARDTAYVVVPHDRGGQPQDSVAVSRRVTRIRTIEPNPANPSAAVHFETAVAGHVRVSIFDVRGRHVAVLADAPYPAGAHVVRWNGVGVNGAPAASGVYFVLMEAGTIRATRRLVLLR